MDFKSPYFLFALAFLAIPVIIHLFNLRRYKKLHFPSVRMLEEVVVKNKRLSRVQKWLLLSSRLLTLLCLILAFAQPFWNNSVFSDRKGQWVVFIDNSLSTSYLKGQQSAFEKNKAEAIHWIKDNGIQDFMVLSHDAVNNYMKFDQASGIEYIRQLRVTPYSHDISQVLNSLVHIQESAQNSQDVLVLLVTDFQKTSFGEFDKGQADKHHISFFSLGQSPVAVLPNIYIDTAYFTSSPTSDEPGVPMVTIIKSLGLEDVNEIQLNYDINGQSVAGKTLRVAPGDSVVTDTQLVYMRQGEDNHIQVGFQSKELSFDDTYYLSARLASSLKVAVVNSRGINHYITQAYNSSRKIFPEQFGTYSSIQEPGSYSLIFFNNVNGFSTEEGDFLKRLLDEGQSVAISFDRHADRVSIQNALNKLGDIKIEKSDTTAQNVVEIQTSHPLLNDVIAHRPENIQLPIVNYRYVVRSSMTARPQEVMRYKDGTGFITQYNISNGILYLFSSPIDLVSNNFTQSYYFAPVLYKMATNSSQADVQSYIIQGDNTVWLNSRISENAVLSLTREEYKSIPVQKREGNGTALTLPPTLLEAGFYNIEDNEKRSVASIALNYSRQESLTAYASAEYISNTLGVTFVSISGHGPGARAGGSGGERNFWKWFVAVALAGLILETIILLRKDKGAGV